MVDCWLPYGETEVYVSVEMDYLLGIAKPSNVEPEKSPSEIIVDALAEPIGSRLEELLGRQTTVAIAVENYSSPNAVVQTLREVVKSLVELIIPRDRITIIIGNGDHERNKSPIIDAIKESADLGNIRVVVHSRDTAGLVDLGATNRGTPVKINGMYHDASLKIAVGETRLDQYMGFSGAHNAVVPGISSLETIKENLTLSPAFFKKHGAALKGAELTISFGDTPSAKTMTIIRRGGSGGRCTNIEWDLTGCHHGLRGLSWFYRPS